MLFSIVTAPVNFPSTALVICGCFSDGHSDWWQVITLVSVVLICISPQQLGVADYLSCACYHLYQSHVVLSQFAIMYTSRHMVLFITRHLHEGKSLRTRQLGILPIFFTLSRTPPHLVEFQVCSWPTSLLLSEI